MDRFKWLILLLLLFPFGCLDPIEFDIPDGPSSLVIDGVLNLTEPVQQIRLSRSLPFEQKFIDPETDAAILLNIGDDQLPYAETEDGIYQLELAKGRLRSGETYSIEIRTKDGNTYLSKPETMPFLQRAEEARSVFEREIITSSSGQETIGTVLNTYLTTNIDNQENPKYFKWLYNELYLFTESLCSPLQTVATCYVSLAGNNQNYALLDARNVAGDRLEDIRVASKMNFPLREFQSRHYFIIYQQSITPQAYEYWSRVRDITRQEGTVFDKPPAVVIGNVYNPDDEEERVLGYFELAAVDTIRPFIFPSEFAENVTRETVCSPFNFRNWPRECCSCLSLPNSSLVRPAWIDN